MNGINKSWYLIALARGEHVIIDVNILKHNWPLLGRMKTSLVVFFKKKRTSSVVFLATIFFSNGLIWPLEIILWQKKTTNLVYLWPNIDQLCFKVLSWCFIILKIFKVIICIWFSCIGHLIHYFLYQIL